MTRTTTGSTPSTSRTATSSIASSSFPPSETTTRRRVPWEGDKDDRQQVNDNFYLEPRLAGEPKAGRASADPRDSFAGGLFYKLDVCAYLELVCLDSTDRGGVSYVSHAAHAPGS